MSRKWLEQEGPDWIEKQIITREQYDEILNLYPVHQRRMQLLPMLASVLVGLSLLTFVASNWDGMSHMVRLIILFLTMTGFYTFGYSFYQKGHFWVGQGLLALGVVSFGASMVLIGQMYHLIAYDARLFVFWSLAAIGLLYLLRRTFFFYLASVLLLAGQIYAMISFGQVSYLLIVITLVALGFYAYDKKQYSYGWILAFLIGLQSLFLCVNQNLAMGWVGIIPIALYVAGLWLGDRPVARGFKVVPISFSFGFATFMVFFHEYGYKDVDFLPNLISFAVVYLILLGLAMWKMKRDFSRWSPFLLFLPLFYFAYGGLLYLIFMFLYSGILIYLGDQERQSWKANLGVFLFLVSSIVGYFQLAWDFLDKSIFFLVGGVLLFSIHLALRKRNRWLAKGGE